MIELHPEIIRKNGSPESVVLPYEEFLRLQDELAERGDARFGGFRDNLSADELARRQGVQAIADPAALAWPFGAADWEGFEEAVKDWRREQVAP